VRFADHYGIKYQTFASWRKARKRRRAAAEVSFAEVVLEDASKPGRAEAGGLCIELPGGARVQVRTPQDAELAAAVLGALREQGEGVATGGTLAC
jgi:hypothetical protein